jgi:hypothetical protein
MLSTPGQARGYGSSSSTHTGRAAGFCPFGCYHNRAVEQGGVLGNGIQNLGVCDSGFVQTKLCTEFFLLYAKDLAPQVYPGVQSLQAGHG